MQLTAEQFDDFFKAVYGYPPFLWQSMLARRVAAEGWPEGIDLPTASGKTACLDIAVFTLALSAEQEDGSSRPRRIFFVVDRRIVVDEAAERAKRLAEKLQEAESGILQEVADRLRDLAGSGEPLVVARMRGGTLRDDRWVENPAQPAIITSTVDQVGSRLLFRGYGPGKLSQSIHAGLAAYDSLILLDEAHCAIPFMQTARAVRRYAGPDWMDPSVAKAGFLRPLEFVVLSATLPPDIPQQKRFPSTEEERNQILADEALQPRAETPKQAHLAIAQKPGNGEWTLGQQISDDPLVLDLAQRAADLADQGYKRIAIMVNRVAAAWLICRQLQRALKSQDDQESRSAGQSEPAARPDVVLMTGRMRPIDRDRLVEQWSPVLKAGAQAQPVRPVIVVTTQCLEVGADFGFDALLTECASLDALRQRFGRLNRLGKLKGDQTTSVILIGRKPKASSLQGDQRERLADDPIYGKALEATWLWLNECATDGLVDFSTRHMDQLVRALSEDDKRLLLTPSPNAPVMLPAHLDFLCQTAPRPKPDPDAGLFLHGPNRGMPEGRLMFRADLRDSDDDSTWLDIVGLVPPVAAEALSVPLPYLQRWLAGQELAGKLAEDPTGDVEGQTSADASEMPRQGHRFILWRGRRQSKVSLQPGDVEPDDTVVVPADEHWAKLGHHFTRPDDAPLDVAEQAWLESRHLAVLRIHKAILDPWKSVGAIAQLLEWAEDEDRDNSALPELLDAITGYQPAVGEAALPNWLREIAARCRNSKRIETHPAGGVVIFADRKTATAIQRDEFSDEDDSASSATHAVPLDNHAKHVEQKARDFAVACNLGQQLTDDIALAALLHDLGKADARFQAFLRGSWPMAVEAANALAKSQDMAASIRARRERRRRAELPDAFRHEMLSVQLAEQWRELPCDAERRELILHLIAAHHGHARPFAPVCPDDDPVEVTVVVNGGEVSLTANQRKELVPTHRLDSGIAERFWRLTRRYGWWGLAYLEAILRLADWHASAHPQLPSSSSASDN